MQYDSSGYCMWVPYCLNLIRRFVFEVEIGMNALLGHLEILLCIARALRRPLEGIQISVLMREGHRHN